ncbi:MAG: [FeFe] hydrogenase H-cluster radical SAM maturase HydG, partial [Deltaproteobacteria bacterium]|nr:[FeFe] hydrogenase H-cluster radical SAM maturase HydG [Deltaproteobacteria bacterium]
AGEVRKKIYGERLVLFAPIYISNHCVNDCEYCGFRSTNTQKRTKLTTRDVTTETKTLINMGHKRLLLECGEAPDMNTLDYVIEAIDTIYSTSVGSNNIRRVNVNIAPLDLEGFKRLKAADIGTYQLFQETYHRETYESAHHGPKADYTRQLFAHDRAFAAGIDDIGLGVLFGLYDYRFEVIALLHHARYLEDRFGVGPHTVSVPRLRAAPGVTPGVTVDAKYQVSDAELLKIIAVIRLAMPYTGIILSTREGAELREDAFKVGVTQASTGSVATPGGYGEGRDGATRFTLPQFTLPQFTLKDERSVKDFIGDILADGVLPSFCTACYRRGRTGEAFMDLAKPGDIEAFCSPNALLTFKEYIEDFAAPELLSKASSLIERHLNEITDRGLRAETIRRL